MLVFALNQKSPSIFQLIAAGLIVRAILFLSPMHHFKLVMSKLNNAWGQLLSLIGAPAFTKELPDFETNQIAMEGNGRAIHDDQYTEPNKMQRLFLFVCSGNTSRSPMAQAICNKEIAALLKISLDTLSERGVQVLSAGVSAKPGEPMTVEAQQALQDLGVPAFHHMARNLTAERVQQAEVIFCMMEK